jgi:hypothetical protein
MGQYHSDDLGFHDGNPREVPALFVNRKRWWSPKATINLIHDRLNQGSNRIVLMGLWPSNERLDHHLPIYMGLQPNWLPSGFAAILTHGITAHLNAIGVVHEPVEDMPRHR